MVRNVVVCDPPPGSLKIDARAGAQVYPSSTQNTAICELRHAFQTDIISVREMSEKTDAIKTPKLFIFIASP